MLNLESLSLAGVGLLAALDSAPFWALPFGVDAAVVIAASQRPHTFWVVGLLAAFASLPGAALTYYVGLRAGRLGLHRFMSEKRQHSIEKHLRTKGAVALGLLDLVPPPFPFKAVMFGAGAFRADYRRFFLALLAGRVIRFGLESVLAVMYGPQILSWLQ